MAPGPKPKKKTVVKGELPAETYWEKSLRMTSSAIFDPQHAVVAMTFLFMAEFVLNILIIDIVKCKFTLAIYVQLLFIIKYFDVKSNALDIISLNANGCTIFSFY